MAASPWSTGSWSVRPRIKNCPIWFKGFQPAIGRNFGRVEEVEARTRGFLARLIALTAVTGVAVSGVYGLITDNYMAVITVWAIAGPIIGAVVSHYFGPRRNDTG